MLKTVYVGFSFKHHGSHSGYNQIKNYLNYSKIIDIQKDYNLLQSLLRKKNVLFKFYTKIFGFRLWWVEYKLIIWSIFSPKQHIFHLIYGENIYKYLGHFKFGNKIALTLHQPISFFNQQSNEYIIKLFKKVDKIIVVSKELEMYFKKKFPQKEILYIPHGIDTIFFTPGIDKKDQILLIGNWLRNFEFASNVFEKLKLLMPSLSILILTNVNNHKFFNNNCVNLLPSVDDEILLNIYRESKIIFLPLTAFTANNALLEGLACGCKIIISSSSIEDTNMGYSPINYIKDNIDDAVDFLMLSLRNWDSNQVVNYRNFVVNNYNWELIAEKTKKFLLN